MFVLNCFIVLSFLGLTYGGTRAFCILVGFFWKAVVCSRGEGAVNSVREWETTRDGFSCTNICPSPAGRQRNGSKTYFLLIRFSTPLSQDKL